MGGSDPVFSIFGTGAPFIKGWSRKGMHSQCRGTGGPVLVLTQRKSLGREEGETETETERGIGGERD